MKKINLANGQSTAFYDTGKTTNALPVVLLHGFCEDSSVWDAIMPFLNELRIIRVDLPGFGKSALPHPPGMDAYADAVYAVLDGLELEQCLLAGHSMGGYTALAFARRYPGRLAGLSLLHSHPYRDTPEKIENRRRGIDMLQSGRKNLYVAQLFPGLFAPDFARLHPELLKTLIAQGCRQPTGGITAALQAMIDRDDHLDTLRQAGFPVQFILGGQDAIVPPEQGLAAAALPAMADVHLFPEVGHMGMFEAPRKTAAALAAFWQLVNTRNRADANKTQTII